ncbi:PfkB family carbohydrate kinase [Streptomyces sp. NPDC001292]|uniref:PfkB family carbohydrate kinase n=1 Tax=Streptomyces sp. NPDC001292 TaxID=3364558 RepID=UPI00368B05EB
MTYDLITLGRVGVDLYPQQTGVGLAEVRTFAKYLGGSATNVAVAAARHGLRSAVVTGVGDDPLGGFVRDALRGFGVDDRHVVTVPGALAGRDPGTDTVLDLDWRPMFWDRAEDAPARYAQALEHATVAVGNRDEVEVAVGTRDPDRAADLLLARGVRLAVVKQGPHGVLARTATEDVRVPPIPVEVVNGLGAGDAFGGALVAGLLAGLPLADTLAAANAAGALVASRHACADAMPTPDEIAELTGRPTPRAVATTTTGEPR